MQDWLIPVLSALGAAIIFGIIGFLLGIRHRKRTAEALLGSAEEESKRILSEAIKNAEAKKKEAILEAKDEIHQLRNESEKELKDRRREVQRQENRMLQKEEALEKKLDLLEQRDEKLQKRTKEIEERMAEAEELKKHQFEMLERISGLTQEQAKEHLLKDLDEELTHEKAMLIQQL